MNDTGFLTILMNFLAPFLLGAALAYLMLSTRRRREDPNAQNRTARATEELYDREESKREEREDKAEERRREMRA